MSLSKGLAAVLRTARSVRGVSQQDLGATSDRKHFSKIENEKASPTLNKFDDVAAALSFNPVTLLALCVALRDQISPSEALARAQKEIEEFEALGGMERLQSNFAGSSVKSRANERLRKLSAVQECKRQGFSQRETIEKLGIPRSTVNDLWNCEPPESDPKGDTGRIR